MARRRKPGAARDRALRRGCARGLPALHVDRRRRHAVARPSQLAGQDRQGLARAARAEPGTGRRVRRRAPLPARDVKGTATVPVVYTGSVPDLFRAGRDIVVKGALRERRLRRDPGHARDEVPVEVHAEEELATCLSWAAQRSSSASGSRSTRSSRASAARARRRRRLAVSAQNALLAAFARRSSLGRAARRARAARLLLHLRRGAHEPRAADCVQISRVLGRPGGLAPALAARPDRLRRRRRAARPQRRPRAVAWVVPVLGVVASFFALLLVVVASPFQTQLAPRRRRRAEPEPAEPVHDRPPAAALPRLRRPDRAVRVRDGRAALGPHGRALDRRHPPLDARRVDVPRRRPAARRALGVRGGRLGRLLRLGPGRERRADAVARRDRVPALGDGPGEAAGC